MGRSILIPYLHKLLNLAVTHGFPWLWTQSLIVPIFKNGDKSIPSNYKTIMVSHILAKLYGPILEKKLSLWLEIQGKRAKGKFGFRRHHSTIDHLVTLRIIAEECHNSKFDLLSCFVDFIKSFETVPWDKFWDKLKEIMVPPQLRIVVIYLYETITTEINTNRGLSKDIKCNIRVKKGCPISPTFIGTYIDKL